MAVPRPVLLALLGLALCAAAFLATRGAQDPGSEITVAPTPAPAPAAPAQNKAQPPAKPKKAEAAPAPKAAEQNPARTDTERALEGAEMAARASDRPKAATNPAPAESGTHQTAVEVTRALGKGDVVVFFFTHHGAADDQQTRQAVATLQDQKDVLVVQAGLEDLADYRPVLAGAGVSQVPSIVIVHADKPARLIEGYVDPGTLHQAVADALR
jgi:hypothetical protein